MNAIVRLSILSAFLITLLPGAGAAQSVPPLSSSRAMPGYPAHPEAVPIPPGRQVFYDLKDLVWMDDAPGVTRATVSGETISFTLVRLNGQAVTAAAPGAEQAIMNMEGRVEVDDIALPEMEGVILPGEPGLLVRTSGDAQFLICSNTPAIAPLASAKNETALPGKQAGMRADFNRLSWVGEKGKSRFKTLSGAASTLTLFLLPASIMGGTQEPGHHHTMEQITYVLSGRARARVGDQIRDVGPGALIMIPPDVDHLALEPINNEDLLVIDFQPAVRQDLLDRQAQQNASEP